jgi:hypothetical protein
MGNLINSNLPLGSLSRASMLKSVFELRQLTQGMQQLSCDVVFGSPSADCLGTGVCKISARTSLPSPYSKSRNCQSAPGILIPIEGGIGVSLVIAREMMCIKLMRTQFRNGVLTLHEPCRLPNDVISALSLKIKIIKPGTYQLEEVDGFFRINFR